MKYPLSNMLYIYLLCLYACFLSYVAHAKTSKPHILLIVLDDVGRADTEVYGKIDISTPKLKDLAKNGITLGHLYTQTVCSPTRSALMTGIYPFRYGMQHRTTQLPGTTSHIPLTLPTLPEMLANVGYERRAVGKWHCGYAHWMYTPTGRGFQSHFGYFQAEIDYYNKTFFSDGKGTGFDFWNNKEPLPASVGKYSLDEYHEAFVNVVKNYSSNHNNEEKQSKEPLFLYYALQSVHIPLEYKKEQSSCKGIKNSARRIYCNMVVEMDDAIGNAIQTFKDNKLWDNTVVFLTTDNGGMVNWAHNETWYPQFPASVGCNLPLRGSKTTLFEGGVRSLAMISGGKNFFNTNNKGKIYNGLMHVVDFSASILRLAGVEVPNRIDGVDQWDDILQFKSDSPKRTSVPINMVAKCVTYTSIRIGNYKLLIDQDPPSKADGYFFPNGTEAIKPNDKKETPFYLFDLDKDPNEMINLVETKDQLKEKSEVVLKAMKEILKELASGYHEPQAFTDFDPRSLPALHNKFWAPFLTFPRDINLLNPKDALTAASAVIQLAMKWFGVRLSFNQNIGQTATTTEATIAIV